MKIPQILLITVTAVAFALVGCKKNGVDTSGLEKSFQSAESTVKSSMEKAVSAIKSSDYAGAMAELKTLAGNAKLTPEQQQAIKDTLAQVQQKVTDAAKKVGEDANKAVGDLQKSLNK